MRNALSFFWMVLLVICQSAWSDTISVSTNAAQYSTAYTTTVTTWSPTNSVFTYYGLPVAMNGSTMYATGFLAGSYPLTISPPVQVQFQLNNASNFEINITGFNAGGYVTPYFNVTDGTTNTSATNSPIYVRNNANTFFTTVNFGTTNTHVVTLWLSSGFVGVNTTNGSITAYVPTVKPNLLVCMADSYDQGFCPPVGDSWYFGHVHQLAQTNGNTFDMELGYSGTGFVRTNTGTGDMPYRYAMTNDCVVISNAVASGKYSHVFAYWNGSINDWQTTEDSGIGLAWTNLMYQYATNVLAYTASQLSNPAISNGVSYFMVGNWLGVGGESSPGANDYAVEWSMTNAAFIMGWHIFDPIPANLKNAGNYSQFYPSGTDSVHPSVYGYSVYAAWEQTNIAGLYGSLWTSPTNSGGGGSGGSTNQPAKSFLWF